MDSVIIALVDVAFVLLLTWRIKRSRFRDLKWTLVGTAAIFWSIFGIFLVSVFWDTFYYSFFPGWFHFGGILIFVPILYGLFALVFYWLALHVPGNPIFVFCLLAGLESVLEHLWGIYGIKILEIPILKEASPASILTFSFPEYIFYWCIVISITVLIQNGWRSWINWQRTRARVV
ncbi:MAG: hypothetical protein ACXWNC_00855 [Anaerolineales bacterium]